MMASSEADGLVGSDSVTPSSPSSAAMDAKARREARKARILGSGTDRLARITKTGRGSEADTLYSDPPKTTLGRTTSASSSSLLHGQEDTSFKMNDEDVMLKRAQAAMAGGALPVNSEDDPGDVDISQTTSVTPSMMANRTQQQQQMPQDLQGMIQMMQNAMMGGAGPPGAGPGQPGQQGASSQSPFPFLAPPASTDTEPPQQKSPTNSLLEISFNLLRVLVFVFFGFALVYSALRGHAEPHRSVLEDESPSVVEKFEKMTTLHRWARLAYEKPAHWEARYFGVESFGLPIHGIPVFWLFITLEIALQSSRIMLQRSRPSPPGLLTKITAYIPNAYVRLLIRTLASYLPLLDGFINDLAVVVFTIGCTIMFAAWKVGLDPILSPTDGSLGANLGLQESTLGQAASSIGEKIMEMNDPVMGGAGPPIHNAL